MEDTKESFIDCIFVKHRARTPSTGILFKGSFSYALRTTKNANQTLSNIGVSITIIVKLLQRT